MGLNPIESVPPNWAAIIKIDFWFIKNSLVHSKLSITYVYVAMQHISH